MRIRLRPPEEGEAPPLPTFPRTPSSNTSPITPLRIPQMDVRSPELIEQRLENLKRKPNWLTYLDAYVKAHPEDDDDDDDGDNTRDSTADDNTVADDADTDNEPGFLLSFACAIGVMALSPAWVLLFPFLRHKGPEFWPLGSPSLWALYKRSVALLVFIGLDLALAFYTLCKELPQWSHDSWYSLQVEIEDAFEATKSCQTAVSHGDDTLTRELCAPIGVDVATLLVLGWLLVHAHKRWSRVLTVIAGVLLFVNVPAKINDKLQPRPEITAIDQPYALLDEEILVAFSGKNLQPGGTIAWVSYWGCAVTSPVASCELQYPSTFQTGYAAVTFRVVDQFIPCYRNPLNPLRAEEFHCFETLRLAVKDKQSIPGWSKASGSPAKPPVTPPSNLSKRKDNRPSDAAVEERFVDPLGQ